MNRPYLAPLGTCCGRTYMTWAGWFAHRRIHDEWHARLEGGEQRG